MKKKKEPVTKPVCIECGKTPLPDSKMSTENWKVCPYVCPDCGGEIKMYVGEEQ